MGDGWEGLLITQSWVILLQKNYYSARPLGMEAYQGTKNCCANWGSAVGVGNVLFQIQRPEVRFMNV